MFCAMRRRRPTTLIVLDARYRRAARRDRPAPRGAAQEGIEIVVGDAPGRAGAAHLAQIDAGLARPLPHRRARRAASRRAAAAARGAERRGRGAAPARRGGAARGAAAGGGSCGGAGACGASRGAAARRRSAAPGTSMPDELGADRQHVADLAASASTVPATGDGISTVALSVITAATTWSSRDEVADLDVPFDDLGLGDALADVGHLDRAGAHAQASIDRGERAADARRGRGNSPTPARADRACPSR